MSIGKRLTRIWNRLWFAELDPLSLGVFRISLGCLLVVFFAAIFPNWDRFFASDGMLSLEQMDPDRVRVDPWSCFHVTENVVPVRAYWWVGFLASICFAVGLQTRLCTIVLFVVVSSMVHRNRMIVNGEDLVFRMLLFYGCFAPLGHSLSVDDWIRRRGAARTKTPRDPVVPSIWPVRLMQINIALIYAISLPNKLVDDVAWLDGTAIYLAMASDMWARWPWPEHFYAFDGLWSKVLTYGTILVEGAFPILVWFAKPRLFVIAALAGLHLGIAVLLKNVTFFTLAMVCSFWVFVPSPDVRLWTREAGAALRGAARRVPRGGVVGRGS